MTVSCHASNAGLLLKGQPVIALVGAPNVGKSTTFNALTHAGVQTGNWPGTSVEVARGQWQGWNVLDLPGAYSLDAMSPDEQLTRDLIDSPQPPDVVVIMADAAHLARSLYIVAQLRERTLRCVVALSMNDMAARQGIDIDVESLQSAIGCPVIPISPRNGGGLASLRTAVERQLAECCPPQPRARVVEVDSTDELGVEDERFAWIDVARNASVHRTMEDQTSFSDRVDAVLTAPVVGPLVFLGIMWLVFQATTTVAAPLQDWLDGVIAGPVTDGTVWALARMGLADGWFQSFLTDGLIAGVGTVLTFVPLMAIMFTLLALLEDSGYMARAAVVTDATMRRLGLPGRAFLPLVVGFGCNVPAISATRVLGDAKQRTLTALLVPFTACTARLTVYLLLASVFFGRWAGTVVFAMYVASILMVLVIGFVLRKTLWRTMGSEPLVLDLPPYQHPTFHLIVATVWQRLKGFLKTATSIIVVTVIAVWVAQATPVRGDGRFGDTPVENSAYAVAAQAITPVFAPTGFASWQTTSALTVGFVAKEAIISSWAQTYAVDEPEEGEAGALGPQIMQTFTESSGGHAVPAVIAFLLFFTAYTPCVATLAAQKREIGVRWTLFGIGMQVVVAWTMATIAFQVLRIFL